MTCRVIEPGGALRVLPGDFSSCGSYASGGIVFHPPGYSHPFQVRLFADGIPDVESGRHWELATLCVDVELRPRSFEDPSNFIQIRDAGAGRASGRIPLPEPTERVKWNPATKKLAAQVATDLLASLPTSEALDQLLAAAAKQYQERMGRELQAKEAAAEAEAARQSVRQQSAVALADARKRWEWLQSEGFTTSGQRQQILWDRSINDQVSLLLGLLEKLPTKRQRTIGIFSATPSLSSVRCDVPVSTECSIDVSPPWEKAAQVTIKPRVVTVHLDRESVFLFPAREHGIEQELNRGRLKWETDGDWDLVKAWGEIPQRVYGPLLRERNSTIDSALTALEGILHGPDFLRAVQHTDEFLRRTGLDSRGQDACLFCSRPLTDSDSLWRGIGPDCWKKVVVAYPEIFTADLAKAEQKLPKPFAMGETTVLHLADGLKEFPLLQSHPCLPIPAEEMVQRLVKGGWEIISPARRRSR